MSQNPATQPTMNATTEEERQIRERFESVLNPAKKLEEILNVDLRSEMEQFMQTIVLVNQALVHDVDSQEHRVAATFDFVLAGTFVIGASQLWTRKVDHLFASSNDLTRALTRRQMKTFDDDDDGDNDATGVPGKKRRRRGWDIENMKVKKGVRMSLTKYKDEKPSNYLNANVLKLMPMVLMPLDEFEKSSMHLCTRDGEAIGRKEDFRVNTCSIDVATGALLLSPIYAKLLDQDVPMIGDDHEDEIRVPRIRSMATSVVPDVDDDRTLTQQNDDVTVARAGHAFENGAEDFVADLPTPREKSMAVYGDDDDDGGFVGDDRADEDDRGVPSIDDLLDEPADPLPSANARRTTATKKVRRPNVETVRKRALKRVIDVQHRQHDTLIEMPTGDDMWHGVKPIHKYIDEEFYMKRPTRNAHTMQNGADYRIEFEPVYEASQKRRLAHKKQWAALAKQLDGDVVKEKEVVAPPMPVVEDYFAESMDDSCVSTTSSIDIDALTFEQLIEELIERRANEAGCLATETAISKRVQAWSEKIERLQATEIGRRKFDIGVYSDEVIAFLRDKMPHEFGELVRAKGLSAWETCRYFLSALMVTNKGNISIDEETALTPNGLTITLMHDRRVGTFDDQQYLQ